MGIPNPAKLSADHKAARVAAREVGQTRFLGDPCRHGHGRLRSTANGGCLGCVDARRKRSPRGPSAKALARAAGLKQYDGAPCRFGHGTRRQTANGNCVTCMRSRPSTVSPAARERVNAKRRSPEARAKRVAAMNKRYATDPTFRLNARMRAAVWKALNRRQRTKARQSWQRLVGYTVDDLRAHLERQFLKGMSWDNADRWHVDHVLPIASFGPMEPADETFRACWALTNLRPLWKIENQRKGPRREHLL